MNNRIVKNALKTAALLILCCSLAGCAAGTTELSDRLAVGAIAVDYAGEKYSVSIACLDPQGGSSEKKNIELQFFEAEGKFLEDAFAALDDMTGRRLFYGHSAGLVISRDVIGERLAETMRYFIQDPATRLGLYVFASEGSAGELIRRKTVHKALAVGAIQAVCENADIGEYELAPIFKLGAALSDDGRRAGLPLLASRPVEATGHEGEVFELFVAGEIGIEQRGGLMYNNFE